MAGNDAAKKFFDALNDNYDALIDSVRAANDRGHRVSTTLIEEAQEGQREAVKLAKSWAESPLDFLNFYNSLIEATTNAQGRTLEATRHWFGELSDSQKETRDVLQRMLNANRAAGAELARGLVSRASEAVQSASQAATDGNGRRTTRETARASAPASSESASTSEA